MSIANTATIEKTGSRKRKETGNKPRKQTRERPIKIQLFPLNSPILEIQIVHDHLIVPGHGEGLALIDLLETA
ncbi:hypothetical protein Q5P01_020483 [Channa striata]|uniref:Uncharacterized protein n=1 Tax=Channa striata TaxID=64152 RepID=A0AA88S3I7_CHASR|nr:hypothetical protein Q5P01_020483 [Channa striata]